MKVSNKKITERRQFFRLDMEKELIDISWQDKGIDKNKKIACFNFSRGGLKIDCDEPIPVSVMLTIRFKATAPKSRILKGKVLRCLKQKNGWFEIALILEASDKSPN